MSEKTDTIDIDSAAKDIAKELLDELKQSGISVTKERKDDCKPSGVRFACEDKDCKSGGFTCHPAKKFTCEQKFVG